MTQSAQITFFIVVLLLTTILSLCGVQVFFILKESRELVKKLSKILDDMGIISSSVAKPISGISGFITGLKSGSELVRALLGKKDNSSS